MKFEFHEIFKSLLLLFSPKFNTARGHVGHLKRHHFFNIVGWVTLVGCASLVVIICYDLKLLYLIIINALKFGLYNCYPIPNSPFPSLPLSNISDFPCLMFNWTWSYQNLLSFLFSLVFFPSSLSFSAFFLSPLSLRRLVRLVMEY